MKIEIPELAIVAIVGVSGSGKSTFCQQHFQSTEVLSSDYFRAIISDDENNQEVTKQAFDTLYYVARKRLELGKLTVIDATNVNKEARSAILHLAKEQNCHAVAIVLDVSEKICRERNQNRTDRNFSNHVIGKQHEQLRRSIKGLQKEGFRYVYVLKNNENSENGINEISEFNKNEKITRVPLWTNKKSETGPFDIIGDIHGCYDELCELLAKLGYSVDIANQTASHANRKAIFLGDLCDRGPKNIEVLRLVMNMVNSENAYCTLGNHDVRLLKYLRGEKVKITHGLEITVKQLSNCDENFILDVKKFIDSRISHYVLDGGNLAVAHAGVKEHYQGRSSRLVREFCLYGDITGETDEYGLPVRLPWARDYRGKATVIYGHIASPNVEQLNNTFCIDTGCVFGGKLTAFCYPEKQIVQVSAAREYYTPIKPLSKNSENSENSQNPQNSASGSGKISEKSDFDLLDINDVLGQKYIETRLRRIVKIKSENSAAALEIMSRFAADPHWLIYLPPTMSPCETSILPDFLEYPTEGFGYYKKRGINQVICEQKHMGSRAVIVVCKNSDVAKRRFNAEIDTKNSENIGIIYTRTGRHFFDDTATEQAILQRLQAVLTKSQFWEKFNTDWVCLDVEIMPWSAKAIKLLEEQYAPVGRSGNSGLSAAISAVQSAQAALQSFENSENMENSDNSNVSNVSKNSEIVIDKTLNLSALLEHYQNRETAVNSYISAYRQYCWNVQTLDDYRIAPFHILATEGKVWNDQTHIWHMEKISEFIANESDKPEKIFVKTPYLQVNLADETSVKAAVQWWEQLTASGGEGMVIKPADFISHTAKNELLQPAIKCRGREYLRIIYGAEYLLSENLPRLKNRSVARKRSLALGEFALGMESLERFVRGEPLYRVHECVFGVLALESEPIDPRL